LVIAVPGYFFIQPFISQKDAEFKSIQEGIYCPVEFDIDKNLEERDKQNLNFIKEQLSGMSDVPTFLIVEKKFPGDSPLSAGSYEDVTGRKGVVSIDIDLLKSLGCNPELIEASLWHEVGHIVKKHALLKPAQNFKINTLSLITGIALYGALSYYKTDDNDAMRSLHNILIAEILSLSQRLSQKYYSRKLERQADDFSLTNCKNAKALFHSASRYDNLATEIKAARPFTWPLSYVESTHPFPAERAKAYMQAAQKLKDSKKELL
jgi:Zn-dependent protease with chaperone function